MKVYSVHVCLGGGRVCLCHCACALDRERKENEAKRNEKMRIITYHELLFPSLALLPQFSSFPVFGSKVPT